MIRILAALFAIVLCGLFILMIWRVMSSFGRRNPDEDDDEQKNVLK